MGLRVPFALLASRRALISSKRQTVFYRLVSESMAIDPLVLACVYPYTSKIV